MKKIIAILFLLIVICFFIIKKDNNTIDDNLDQITVSEVTHSVFYTPWYVAIENGYFRDNNININLVLTQGADKVATSVISGNADIGFSGPEATIYLYNNSNERLISFASLTKRDGQFIVGDCSLKDKFTLKDLENKIVLAGRSGGMPLMMFNYALKEANVDKYKININSSVDFAGLSGAYIANEGDFVNLFEPNASILEKNGYGCVLSSLGSYSGEVPYTTFYAKDEFILLNNDLLHRFNDSLQKGIDFVKNNDVKVIANSIKNQFPDTSIEDLEIYIERYKNNDSWYDSTFINVGDYNRLVDILLYSNAIKEKIDVNKLLTNEFNE